MITRDRLATRYLQKQIKNVMQSTTAAGPHLEKCSLAVDGMTCSSCVQFIERHMKEVAGSARLIQGHTGNVPTMLQASARSSLR